MGPWECRFTSHGHAAVFQLLDSGEKPMANENSDTVMPTCRNPGRLDMANTTENGTDVPSRGLNAHVAEGYVGKIGEAKGRGGALKGVTGVGGANDVVSGAASGNGGTGMLEGTAIGDEELEGTEHELSALDI